MAIYNFSLQTISRSDNRSAVSAAAYRAGAYLLDENTGIAHDLSKRRGIVSRIILPAGVSPPEQQHPTWKQELRSRLWNAAEAAEKRTNSVVAREIVIALPHELSGADRLTLGAGYAQWLADRYRVAVDIAWHSPSTGGDQRNVHVHVQFTTREITDNFVFGPKTRILDAAKTGGPEIATMRAEWAAQANLALTAAGVEAWIDHRSLVDRGIDREPDQHVGPRKTNVLRAALKRQSHIDAELQAIEEEIHSLLMEELAEAWHQEVINEIRVSPALVVQTWESLVPDPVEAADVERQAPATMTGRPPVLTPRSRPRLTLDIVEESDMPDEMLVAAIRAAERMKALKAEDEAQAVIRRTEPSAALPEHQPYDPLAFQWTDYRPDRFKVWAAAWAGSKEPRGQHSREASISQKAVAKKPVARPAARGRRKDIVGPGER